MPTNVEALNKKQDCLSAEKDEEKKGSYLPLVAGLRQIYRRYQNIERERMRQRETERDKN